MRYITSFNRTRLKLHNCLELDVSVKANLHEYSRIGSTKKMRLIASEENDHYVQLSGNYIY